MYLHSRLSMATFCLLAFLFVMAGCQTQSGSDPKAADKTKQVTVEVTGMT